MNYGKSRCKQIMENALLNLNINFLVSFLVDELQVHDSWFMLMINNKEKITIVFCMLQMHLKSHFYLR